MQKLKFILMVIPLFVFSCLARGNNPDSLHSFNSFKLFKLNNYWLKTGNIAGISLNTESNIGIVNTGFQSNNGDFHRIREAGDKNNFFLFSESYKKIKNTSFYGKFSYSYSNEKGMLWNGVFDAYRGIPYIAGDSIPGATYHKETYNLTGGFARKINTHLTFGIAVDYFVGVGAKQKDPRTENIVMNFKFNPSVIYDFGNIQLGFDAGYLNRKEEINYDRAIKDNVDPKYLFFFKGFGFCSIERDGSVDRFYTQKEFFGGIQLETKLFNMNSLTEFRGSYSTEVVEDGSSTMKKQDGGDWKTINLKLNHQSVLKKNNVLHKINLLGSFYNGDGIEYFQKYLPDDDLIYHWVTLSKNLKFNRLAISAKAKYNYLRFKSDNVINWEIESFAGFLINQEKYHLIPEVLASDFLNVDAGLKAIKNYYFNNFHLAPEICVSYTYNLSNNASLFFVNEDEKVTHLKEIYLYDLNYYSTDLLKIAGGITAGFNVKGAKNMDQLYIKAYYERWQTMNEENMGFITGTLGIVF